MELTHGLPVFLDQLQTALLRVAAHDPADHAELGKTATLNGDDLFYLGLTVGDVVHDYGDLCQVITLLAIERRVALTSANFQTLNLCLDDAIASAVTAWTDQSMRRVTDEGTERLGFVAHEMRNLLNTALMSFESIKAGVVAPGGSTALMLERSLIGLQTLIDRSLADVRLDAGLQSLERVPVWEVLSEVEIGASLVAVKMGLTFAISPVDRTLTVDADRQILAATLSNLVQNALKFTRRGTTVTVRAISTTSRVLIEVEDQCGGLPPGTAADLLEPFTQRGRDRTGLGLGLSICVKAAKAMNGELRICDVPAKGCIITVDLPRQAPSPTPIRGPREAPAAGEADSSGPRARAV